MDFLGTNLNNRYIDFAIIKSGHDICSRPSYYGPKIFDHYFFMYVLSGNIVYNYYDSAGSAHSQKINDHQGFLISPNQVFSLVTSDSTPAQYIWLEFDGFRAKELIESSGLNCDRPIFHSANPDLQKKLELELNILLENKDESLFYQLGHFFLFTDCLVRSADIKSEYPSNNLPEIYTEKAIRFMKRNYKNPITMEDIAKECNLNRSYLGKLFRETLNQTPQQYLMRYRMEQASNLLRFSNLSIKEIGRSVGYPNQLHFSRAFRNIYGKSPSIYRKDNKIALKNSQNENLNFN